MTPATVPTPERDSTRATAAPAPYPAFDGTQACQEIGTDAFFPTPGTRARHPAVAMPVAVCASCIFEGACLDYALAHDVSGIWGGTTHLRRKQIRAERGIRAHVVHDVSITRLGGHRGAASPNRVNGGSATVAKYSGEKVPCAKGCGRLVTPLPGPRALHEKTCTGSAA